MCRILITGANGQLGSELRFLSMKYNQYHYSFVDIEELDITNKNAVRAYFEDYQPHYVINCAAYTAVDKAEEEIAKAEKINGDGVANLSQACVENNSKLIHISTDYVYNGDSFVPHKEDDKLEPLGVYGKTKLMGELNCNDASTIILRTSWLYSNYGTNFVKTMLSLGTKRSELKVIYDQVGTPTYAKDLALVILEIIRFSNENKFLPGIYNYSNEGVTSWYDFAKAIFDISEINCKVFPILTREYHTPAERPKYSVMDKSKIKETFNLEIPYWRESLTECLKNNI